VDIPWQRFRPLMRWIGWLALAALPSLLFTGWHGWRWWRAPTGEWFADGVGVCEAADWERIVGGAPPLLPHSGALIDSAEARRRASALLRAVFDPSEPPPVSQPTLLLTASAPVWVLTAPLPRDPASMIPMSEAPPAQPAAIIILDARTGERRDLITAAQSAAPETCRRQLQALWDGLRAWARDRAALLTAVGAWAGWIALTVVMFLRQRRAKRSTIKSVFGDMKGAPCLVS
jgi:hypothetical protein